MLLGSKFWCKQVRERVEGVLVVRVDVLNTLPRGGRRVFIVGGKSGRCTQIFLYRLRTTGIHRTSGLRFDTGRPEYVGRPDQDLVPDVRNTSGVRHLTV